MWSQGVDGSERLLVVLLFVRVLARFARGDVVHFRQFLVRRVHVVEAERAAGVLQRNRAARFVVAFLLSLCAAAALRLGVGTEIPAASRRAARDAAAAGIEGPRCATERSGRTRREA